ncbi:hypothetical protein [Geothrix campi]|uniref:hypothetical protein n=1 Tax=Geothrix campi TaxID=2966450 RepID=UPI0021493B10|nr:hypothetical protein [Geothrix sp. SG10]
MTAKTNPAPAFGSAERARVMKGIKKVSGKSGARAKKRRDRGAKRKAQDHAEKTYQRLSTKEAKGEKLTKAQAAALKRHEPAALRGAGLVGTDAEVMAEAERLSKEHQKQEAAYGKAVARILGEKGITSAVKISRADGTPFERVELEGLQSMGWQIHPGGTIAAQVGKVLKGNRFNPTDALAKALGPEGETRAVVIVAPGITEDTLHRLRGSGYDLSPAPKRMREAEVKTNPAPGKLSRKTALGLLAVAGYHGDHRAWVRVYVENRISRKAADEAWAKGENQRRAGMPCSCWECKPKTNPTAAQPAVQKKVYDALRKGIAAPSDIARVAKVEEPQVEAALTRLQSMGLAHVVRESMFGWEWAPGALQKGLAFNPNGQERPRAATGQVKGQQPGNMTKANPKKAPKKTAPKAAKKPAAIGPDKVQPLKSKAADRHRLEVAVTELLKGKPAPKAKAKTAKATPEKFTITGRFNPTNPADLLKVWRDWTGSDPRETLTFKVDGDTHGMPSHVVVLGRVSRFISEDGKLVDFGESGPMAVTDKSARRIWLLDGRARKVSFTASVICYLARKPKFGDRGLVEYVHAFTRPARVVMNGQVGTLAGGFKITPRGLEG